MTESLVHNLAAHTHIRVVGPIDSVAGAQTSASAGGVSTILSGHVTVHADRLSLTVRLVDAESMEVLWSTEEVQPVGGLARFEAEEQWSRQVASRIGDPSGAVILQELDRSDSSGRSRRSARLAFYAHLLRETRTRWRRQSLGRCCLDAGIRTAPLLAIRGALANSSSIFEFTDTEPSSTGLRRCTRGRLPSMATTLMPTWCSAGRPLCVATRSLAIGHIETAVRLAPYQPFYLIAAGIALSACGEWERGSQLIREAHQLNPGMSALTHAWLAMGHVVEGDYGRALAEASLLPSEDDFGWGSLMRVLALAGLGYEDQARVEAVKLRRTRPDVLADVGGFLDGMMRLTPEQRERLVALVPQ
jgi:hypothetical protein